MFRHIKTATLCCLIVVLTIAWIPAAGQTDSESLEFVPITEPFHSHQLYSNLEGPSGKPFIAFDGTNFLTAWCEYLPNASYCNDIYAARISPAGVVLDPTPIRVTPTSETEVSTPSVGFDGANFVLVYTATRSSATELYAARISPAGVVLDPGGVALTSGASAKLRAPGLVFDGTRYFTVYRSQSDRIYGVRFTPSLTALDGAQSIAVSNNASGYSNGFYPMVAFDGTNYLVVWHDGRGHLYDIYGARVTQAGQVLDVGGFPISLESPMKDHAYVVFDGTNFLVVWNAYPYGSALTNEIHAARVTSTGQVLDNPSILITKHAGQQHSARALCLNGECLLPLDRPVLSDAEKSRNGEVYLYRVASNGVVSANQPEPIATGFGLQFQADLAYGANRILVVWFNSDDSGLSLDGRIFELRAAKPGSDRGLNPVAPPASSTAEWAAQTVSSDYITQGWAFAPDDLYVVGNSTYHKQGEAPWVKDSALGKIYAAWGYNPSDFWVGGWANGVAHKQNGSWSEFTLAGSDPRAVVSGLWGSGSDLWGTVLRGRMIHYLGTGMNFEVIDTGKRQDLNDIWGFPANIAYAVGNEGTLMRYDGAAWQRLDDPLSTRQNLNGVWGSSPQDLFVVGDSGAIYHFNGTAWSRQAAPTNSFLLDVWGCGPNDVFAVGEDGAILYYDGQTWTAQNSGLTSGLMGVWSLMDADSGLCHVWAGSDKGVLLSKTIPGTGFTADLTAGVEPLTTQFTNTSTHAFTSLLWDFGDGQTSTQANPAHIYSSPGRYSPSLTIAWAGGQQSVTRAGYIAVQQGVDANFSYAPDSIVTGLPVQFNNTTSGDWSALSWDFGDLSTATTAQPTHAFSAAGDYAVTLTATGPNNSDSITQTIHVEDGAYLDVQDQPLNSLTLPLGGTASTKINIWQWESAYQLEMLPFQTARPLPDGYQATGIGFETRILIDHIWDPTHTLPENTQTIVSLPASLWSDHSAQDFVLFRDGPQGLTQVSPAVLGNGNPRELEGQIRPTGKYVLLLKSSFPPTDPIQLPLFLPLLIRH
ncbi:MAG TPA: PKD domain-containing protein [Anaerolineaceae bacterium]|nr:PKD domain-containing protein [Anaerolineaceae bacterium]